MTKKARKVEIAYLWNPNYWSTDYIEIPLDTPEEDVERVATDIAMSQILSKPGGLELAACYLFNASDPFEEEDDLEEEEDLELARQAADGSIGEEEEQEEEEEEDDDA